MVRRSPDQAVPDAGDHIAKRDRHDQVTGPNHEKVERTCDRIDITEGIVGPQEEDESIDDDGRDGEYDDVDPTGEELSTGGFFTEQERTGEDHRDLDRTVGDTSAGPNGVETDRHEGAEEAERREDGGEGLSTWEAQKIREHVIGGVRKRPGSEKPEDLLRDSHGDGDTSSVCARKERSAR